MLLLWLLFAASDAQELLSNPRCNLPLDRGSCDQFTVQWYYDRYDHRCRRFHYGGCEGNENRFNTLEECNAACHFEPTSNRERCFQPHDPGECNNDFERWFFDANKKQCVCSWWTGCGGNSNLFYSYPHCMYYCGEFAEHGPGMDENYWARRNKSIFPHASLAEVALAGSHFRIPQRPQQRFHIRRERSLSDWSLQDSERENYGLEQQLPDQRSQNYEQALRRTREEDSSESYLQSSMNGDQGDYQRAQFQQGAQSASEQQLAAYRPPDSTNGDQRARYQQTNGQRSSTYAFADKQQASYPQSVVDGQPSGVGGRGGGYQHAAPTDGDQRARYQQTNGQRSSTYAFADKQQASYPQSVIDGQPSGVGGRGGGYQHAASADGDQRAWYQQANGQRSSSYAFADKQQASYPQSVVDGQPSGIGGGGGGYQHAASSNGDRQTHYRQSVSLNGDHRTQYQQSATPNGRTTVITRNGPGYTDQRVEQQQWSQKVQPSSRYSEFRSSSSRTYAAQSHFHSTSVQGGYPQQTSNGWYSQLPRARGDRIYRFDSGPVTRRHANGITTMNRQTILIAQHRQPRMRFAQELPGLVELTHISSPGFHTMAPPLRKKLKKLKKKKIPPRLINPKQSMQNLDSSFKMEPAPIQNSRSEQSITPTRRRSQISRERTNRGEDHRNIPQQDSPSNRQEEKKHNNFTIKENIAPTLPAIVLPPAIQPTPSLAPTLPPIVLPPAPTLLTPTLPPIVLPPATQPTLSLTLPLLTPNTPSTTVTTPEPPSLPPTPRQAEVRNMVIDAGVLFKTSPRPTTRVEAEPIELIRPVVTSVPAKKVNFDEVLAMDAEYYDEYEEPIDEPVNSSEPNTEILTTKAFGRTTTPASAVRSTKSTIPPIVVPPPDNARIDDRSANLIPERRKGAENQLVNLVPPTTFEHKQAVPAQSIEWTPIVFPVDHQTSTTHSTATEDYPENVEFDIQTVGIEG
ncbi:unnamed protein product [Cylicocyclus nassatus]|uniref:BPTI/Kunitz inhibitor domain-containing protein n=1 Tax=Cylicocyclus nassatus TaxID=53992 RepID=A0AA36DMT5_CYLNA|nr:unnamed protein product [Cylicocyclus nassatus]